MALLKTQIGRSWRHQVVKIAGIARAEMATAEISKAKKRLPVPQTQEAVSIPTNEWESMISAIDAVTAWQ